MSKPFNAAEQIAKQEATIARNRAHFASQRERVERGDVLGYWQAELEIRKDVVPISREAEVCAEALRQLVAFLEAATPPQEARRR